VTQLGAPFSLDASASSDELAAKVGEAFAEGGVDNAKMLGIRLVGKFVQQYPDVVAQ
jgi:hypothetical protein